MYADEDTKCQLCKIETETLEHLLLDCTELSNIRNPILRQIQDIFLHHSEYDLCRLSYLVTVFAQQINNDGGCTLVAAFFIYYFSLISNECSRFCISHCGVHILVSLFDIQFV
jgi:hypothetical protein